MQGERSQPAYGDQAHGTIPFAGPPSYSPRMLPTSTSCPTRSPIAPPPPPLSPQVLIDASGLESRLVAREDPFLARGSDKQLPTGYQVQ